MQRGLGGPRVLWREARPTAEAVAAWPVADTGGRGKNPRIPGVQVAETVIQPYYCTGQLTSIVSIQYRARIDVRSVRSASTTRHYDDIDTAVFVVQILQHLLFLGC